MRHIADVLCIRGTWTDTSRPDAWTRPGGALATDVLDAYGWRVQDHPPEWDGAEHGLAIQQFVGHVTGRNDGLDWDEAGKLLAHHVYDEYLGTAPLRSNRTPLPLIVCAHSHGNQVAAHAFDILRNNTTYPAWAANEPLTLEAWRARRPVFWLAVDPPVRRELQFIYNAAIASLRMRNAAYHGLAGGHGFCLQTRSSAWNPRSWPRYLGARRWPWDASVLGAHTLTPALQVAQPGGHSQVLLQPEKHLEWWDGITRRVNDVFNGGTPVLP